MSSLQCPQLCAYPFLPTSTSTLPACRLDKCLKKLKTMKILIFLLFLVIFEHVTASNSLWEENEMEKIMKTSEISRKKRFLSFNFYRCQRWHILYLTYCIFRVIRWIRTQEQGCFELVLWLMLSLKASICDPKTGRNFPLGQKHSVIGWQWSISDPDRGSSKKIWWSGDFSSIYRVSNVQDFFFLYWIFTAIGFTS